MCCRDYNACVFAAVWSIVQTAFHLAWCIWGKQLYECRYELNNKTFKYFWYLTYFYTDSCVNATLDNLFASSSSIIILMESEDSLMSSTNQSNQTFDMYKHEPNIVANPRANPRLVFPPESAVAGRTYNIFQTFIIVDSLWIIAAVALLIGTCYRIRNNLATVFYFPWTVVLLIILFFDGIAASWYGIDISYTYGLSSWFLFIGGRNQTGLDEIEAKFPKAASTQPSILMMVFFSRFFVVWFVNLFLFFRVVQAAVNAVEDFDDQESLESKHLNQGHFGNENVFNNQRSHKFQVRDINPNTASVRIRRWQLYYGTDEEEEEIDRVARRYSRRNSKQKHQARDKRRKSRNVQCNIENVQNLAIIGGYEGDRSTSPSPLPDGGGQIRNSHNNFCLSGCESNDTYLKYDELRGSSPSIYSDYAEVNEYQGTRPPRADELRKQLPSSYFQDQTVLAAETSNNTLPVTVPIADYSFHNKDMKRVNVF